jgi:hypothetical protein
MRNAKIIFKPSLKPIIDFIRYCLAPCFRLLYGLIPLSSNDSVIARASISSTTHITRLHSYSIQLCVTVLRI